MGHEGDTRALAARLCRRAAACLLAAGSAGPMVATRAAEIPDGPVQLYGLTGTYIASLKRSDMSSRQITGGSGGLTTSYWGIRGSEHLGAHYRLIFALEGFFQPNNGNQGRSTSDPFLSRNAYVGIAGDFGQLTLGRQANPTYLAMQAINPFGASVVFSPLVLQSFVSGYGGALLGDTVWSNVVRYQTPDLAGLSATVDYGFSDDASRAQRHNAGLHLRYAYRGWTAAISAQRVGATTLNGSSAQKAVLAGAAYDFGPLELYAAGQTSRNEAVQIGTRTFEFGASVPVSRQGAVLAEFARMRRSGPGNAAGNNTTRRTAALGYDHRLSKRTDVYGVLMADRLSGHGTGCSVGAGLRHTF